MNREHTHCTRCKLSLIRTRTASGRCACLRCGATCRVRAATFREALSLVEALREEYWNARWLLALR